MILTLSKVLQNTDVTAFISDFLNIYKTIMYYYNDYNIMRLVNITVDFYLASFLLDSNDHDVYE